MLISVIIPTYNKLSRLKLTLHALLRQRYPEYEIIIVDDGSDVETREYLHNLKDKNADVIRIISQINQGRARARNIGARHAKGDRLVFVDDDIIVDKDFVDKHAVDNDYICHGRIETLSYLKFFENPSTGSWYSELHGIPMHKSQLHNKCIKASDIDLLFEEKISANGKLSRSEKLISKVFQDKIKPLFWIGVTGANFSISSYTFKKIGGFDESYGKLWGYEDFDLGYRLLTDNQEICYSNAAKGYHIAHYRKNDEACNENAKLFISKYHDDALLKDAVGYLCGDIGLDELLEKVR